MQNTNIARFITSCVGVLLIIIFNVAFYFQGGKATLKPLENSASFSFFDDAFEPILTQSTPAEIGTESSAAVSSTTQSEATATPVLAGAVKGNILSKYVSPYSAGASYDGIYLKNSTGLNIDLKKLSTSNLKFKIAKNDEPQVLIIHTHASESFMEIDSTYYTDTFTSRSTDNEKNMVKIGAIVAEKLNAAGIVTLHDTTLHDYPQYNGSYTRSAKTINSYLKKYPSIKVVLDLHRDAISQGSDKVKLVTEIGGKKAAQVMLVMGSQSGSVTNFPNWQENLKLALKLQQTMEKTYPTLARPLSLMSKNYNQSLTTGSLLIEFGTDANSLAEVHYSAELVGDCLVTTLQGLS